VSNRLGEGGLACADVEGLLDALAGARGNGRNQQLVLGL
jgi:hypothetical protein